MTNPQHAYESGTRCHFLRCVALETSSQPRGVPERSRVCLHAQFWRGSKRSSFFSSFFLFICLETRSSYCSGHVSKDAACRSHVGAMSTTHHVYDRRRGHAAVTPRNRDLGDLSSRFHALLHTPSYESSHLHDS